LVINKNRIVDQSIYDFARQKVAIEKTCNFITPDGSLHCCPGKVPPPTAESRVTIPSPPSATPCRRTRRRKNAPRRVVRLTPIRTPVLDSRTMTHPSC